MKRFGLSVLLSAVYVGTLIFVFSTEFSKQNSFLFSEPVQEKAVVTTPDLMPVETPETSNFIQLEVDDNLELILEFF